MESRGHDISVRSVLYLLLVACCAMVMALQCWYLVTQYLEEPVAIDMDTISGVTEAPFPAFTVCDNNHFSRKVARAWGVLNNAGLSVRWNRFPWANRSVTEFWEEAAPPLNHLVIGCNINDCRPRHARGGNTSKGVWTAGWYRRGICYTFQPNGPIVRKRQRHLQLDLHSDPADSTLQGQYGKPATPSVHLFIHGAVPPIVDQDFDDAEMTTHLVTQPGDVSRLLVSARQRRLQPLRRRPCDASPGYSRPRCLVLCRWGEWVRAIGCRPPWRNDTSLPVCSSTKDFLMMLSKNLKLPEDDQCPARCLPACVTTIYQLQVAKLTVVEHLRHRHTAIVKVIWPYTADRTSERLSYSGTDLLSDVGGSLGLLLGLSVVSAVQLAETAVRSLIDRCRRRGKVARQVTRQVSHQVNRQVTRQVNHHGHHGLGRHRHGQTPAATQPVLNAKTIVTVSEKEGGNAGDE